MVPNDLPRLTLVIDPRFSGGTSSAVAREIHALASVCKLSVAAISSEHFKGTVVHPLIREACEATHTSLTWDPAIVSADLVALHNPSFLKFNRTFETRIVCDRLFVVCHENFLRPDGPESFDVSHCLDLISGQTLARKKYLSPVSGWNRQCAETWLLDRDAVWQIAPLDWTNICDFELIAPVTAPRDRRGRHSRPGMEKFPSSAQLGIMFPDTTESVRMLGADSLLGAAHPAHWELLPFGAETVDDFLRSIDFFVYFTHPFLQESFGRVIAEALAAGKVVITSSATAATFGEGVIAAVPEDVDAIIARLIATPETYAQQAKRGYAVLEQFGAAAFRDRFAGLIAKTNPTLHGHFEKEPIYDFL